MALALASPRVSSPRRGQAPARSVARRPCRQPRPGALPLLEDRILSCHATGRALEVAEHLLEPPQPVAGELGERTGELQGDRFRLRGGRRPCQQPQPPRLLAPHRATREDQVLRDRQPNQRHEARHADWHAQPRAGPRELEVVPSDAQIATGCEFGSRAHAVPHAYADRRHGKRLNGRVHAGERLHSGHPAIAIQALLDVRAGAQRSRAGGGQDEHTQLVVLRQRRQRALQLCQRRRVQCIPALGTVEP